jgi:hypothetical protein
LLFVVVAKEAAGADVSPHATASARSRVISAKV